jgi:hypothetical protein
VDTHPGGGGLPELLVGLLHPAISRKDNAKKYFIGKSSDM